MGRSAGIRPGVMPRWQARLLPNSCTLLLLGAALLYAIRPLVSFSPEAALVCPIFHVLRFEMETFAGSGEGFSIPPPPAELL